MDKYVSTKGVLPLTDNCLILDCFSLTYRAFFGMPTTIRTRQGTAINAVLGFYNTLTSLIKHIQPRYVVVASDYPEKTFRHHLFPSYKGQRPPMPDELRSQLPLIREVLDSFGIPVIEIPGFEADDVMGTIAQHLPPGITGYIVTTDRDALQLVNDQISIFVPNSKANKIYTPETVEAEWHVPPRLIPDLKALMGDNSDNIPGVPKVGPKTAVKWLQQYGSLEGLLADSEAIKGKVGENLRQYKQEALLYKELATIKTDVPILTCWRSNQLKLDREALRQTLLDIGIAARLPETS